jgi:hypothetical protein
MDRKEQKYEFTKKEEKVWKHERDVGKENAVLRYRKKWRGLRMKDTNKIKEHGET